MYSHRLWAQRMNDPDALANASGSDVRAPSAGSDGSAGWQPWTASEREDFLDAIARHRRNAWRVTAPCALASLVLGFILAILLAPLLYTLLGLALDVINLLVPTPDLLGYVGGVIEPLVSTLDSDTPASGGAWSEALLLAAIPGLLAMALTVFALRRALRQSPLFDPAKTPGRPPNATVLSEQRFAHTVQEMAIAAMIPVPRVAFVVGGANAAAFGPDEAHAVVLAGTGLLSRLDRQQMQGVAGHLVASIADGDMKIGMRTAMTLGLFALPGALSAGWSDRARFAATMRLLRALPLPTPTNLDLILKELNDPFRQPTADDGPAADSAAKDELTWREWALMPLMGPVLMSGFLSGLVSTMMLAPAVALAWRQRKYMADANAVRLTREANAMAGALVAISKAGAHTPIASWAGHLCVVDPGSRQDAALLGGSYASLFPPLRRRLQALIRMGADAQVLAMPAASSRPLLLTLLVAPLIAIVAVLMGIVVVLLIWLSLALSGLFTVLPATLLHAVLR